MKKSLLTLGAGNMATALLLGMKGSLSSFYAYSPSGKSAESLADKMGGVAVSSLSNIQSDILFLSFKPQQYSEATKSYLDKSGWSEQINKPLVVSMLAGTPLEGLERTFSTQRVVRIMPNTPSLVGRGIILVLFGGGVEEKERQALVELLECAGKVFICDNEEQLDAVTAVTGSGPAYIFEFARQMSDFLAHNCQVDSKSAQELVAQLFVGSSLLMENSSETLETLRDNVTSKKGVTFEALESFKTGKWQEMTFTALKKNINRSLELRREALSSQ